MDEQENASRISYLFVIYNLHHILANTYNVLFNILVHGVFG